MKTQALSTAIDKVGLKKRTLADRTGINQNTFRHKISSKITWINFTEEEEGRIATELRKIATELNRIADNLEK